ncbi:hypothetical protein [Pseudonocardia nigra]|uniref:hypothetical protein n=1 Tax=Pseudonocardia nigra TaxID=1921578 RepID=UPI001C5D3E49|nr:hypothetical protein [Pseudonocardia nigra]
MDRPKVLYAEADLLDRQLVAADGRLIGKVDDLELSDERDGPPHVVALLVGSAALGPRLGRGPARWLAALGRRRGTAGTPIAIGYGDVTELSTAVTVREGTPAPDLAERWLRDHIIDRIPGARRADR